MTTTTGPATGRVPFWDNARFVAVTLVVVGHGVQRLTYSDSALVAYLFIYAFHVPAFSFISGYFSKSGPLTARDLKKLLTDLVLPYLIMEAIWSVVQWLVEGRQEFNPTTASWTLWFLLALAIFRLVLPYLALVRFPLLWAVVLSVSVGYFDNVDSTFSLSRAIGLLPFFVLGWKVRQWGVLDRLLTTVRGLWWLRAAGAAVLAAWLAVVVLLIGTFRDMHLQAWFFYDDSYRVIGADQWWAGGVRLGFMALGVLLTAAFLALVPRRETWVSDLGRATMYIYLLHSFVLYPIRETGILKGHDDAGVWLAAMVLAGVAISLALASPLVRRVFRPLVDPKPRWLFAPTSP